MLSEEQVAKIKRMRKHCYAWREISEAVGAPITTCRYAIGLRNTEPAIARNRRKQKQAERIRLMRRHIEYLENRLRAFGVQPPNRPLLSREA